MTSQLQDSEVKGEELMWKPRISQPGEPLGDQPWRRVDLFTVFNTVPELAHMLKGLEDKVHWVKPASWCQKAYDFLCFLRQENRLNILASPAKSHSVLLCVVNKLATTLNELDCLVDTIFIDFLVPVSIA